MEREERKKTKKTLRKSLGIQTKKIIGKTKDEKKSGNSRNIGRYIRNKKK